jgi:hypothetical protein
MSKKYRSIIQEGTHLASSKNTDGAYRGSLLDDETNKVVGQAEWEPVEEDDDDNWNYPSESNSDGGYSISAKESRERIEL